MWSLTCLAFLIVVTSISSSATAQRFKIARSQRVTIARTDTLSTTQYEVHAGVPSVVTYEPMIVQQWQPMAQPSRVNSGYRMQCGPNGCRLVPRGWR